MEIIAIANQKGGTAKTTTAAALGILMSRAGRRVHLSRYGPAGQSHTRIWSDPSRRRVVSSLGHWQSLTDFRTRRGPKLDAKPHHAVPRSRRSFITKPGREHCLARSLTAMRLPRKAVVLIDCPPSLGVLAVNCLTAAQRVLIVVQPGGFELQALVHFEETIKLLREWVNPQLRIIGAVITNCHRRRKITAQVADEVARAYPLLGCVRTDAQLLVCHHGPRSSGIASIEGTSGLRSREN